MLVRVTMYLIAENLVNVWDVIKDEFKKTQDPQRQTPADCNDVSTVGTVRWYIHRVECGQQDHPTGKTHLVHSGCRVLVLWLSMTPVLNFTNCIHNHFTPLIHPRRKANITVEQLRKGNPCHAVLVILRKRFHQRIKRLEKNTDCHDSKVLFCLYMIQQTFSVSEIVVW